MHWDHELERPERGCVGVKGRQPQSVEKSGVLRLVSDTLLRPAERGYGRAGSRAPSGSWNFPTSRMNAFGRCYELFALRYSFGGLTSVASTSRTFALFVESIGGGATGAAALR